MAAHGAETREKRIVLEICYCQMRPNLRSLPQADRALSDRHQSRLVAWVLLRPLGRVWSRSLSSWALAVRKGAFRAAGRAGPWNPSPAARPPTPEAPIGRRWEAWKRRREKVGKKGANSLFFPKINASPQLRSSS